MTKGNKTTTHKSFSASPRPACSCLCCRNPEKSGAGLSRESELERKQPGGFHRRLRASRPGLVLLPRVQGRRGRGWLGTRLGSGTLEERGKEPLRSGRNCWGEYISIPYQLLPATNQPSQGALVSVTREHQKPAGSERDRTAPCLQQKFGRIGISLSIQLLIIFACY